MTTDTISLAFGLTIMAGLATGIGSLLAFFAKRNNAKVLTLALGFSAGVMLYVSFVEIIGKGREGLTSAWGPMWGEWGTAGAFFAGIVVIGVVDAVIPAPHEIKEGSDQSEEIANTASQRHANPADSRKLMRMGTFMALAIAIHNFPEGLATFAAALENPQLGIAIAAAIAIHNIPEGIAVSVPIYYATGSRKKAFWLSFLSGLAEPLGALLGFAFLMHYSSETVMSILFAMVAGIMVFISLDELLPTAERYGEHHLCIYGVIGGMAVMALSLLLVM